ncbi:D(2) dopamine receptor A-like [Vanacampus margaritifer]
MKRGGCVRKHPACQERTPCTATQHVGAMPTPDGNGTASGERVRAAFLAANCFILTSTSVAGLAANAFVILAVCRQRSLRTWTNGLLVNLAAVDILRCVGDCPVLLAVLLLRDGRGRDARRVLCDVQVASFSFVCCSQLSTLACIGAERYRAVARPFESGERRRRILASIPLTWLWAVLVAFLCLTYAKDSPVHARCTGSPQSSSYDTFGIYVLFPLWAACFGVTVGFYARIFVLVRAHNRKIFDKGIFPVSNNDKMEGGRKDPCVVQVHQTEADSTEEDSNLAPTKTQRNEICSNGNEPGAEARFTELPAAQEAVQSERLERTVAQPSLAVSAVKSAITNGRQPPGDRGAEKRSGRQLTFDQVKATSLHVCTFVTDPAGSTGSAAASPVAVALPASGGGPLEAPDIQGAVCMMPAAASRERCSKSKESRTAKRAGYIILTFLVFWTPLVITVLVNWIVHRNRNTQNATAQEVEILSVSIACITSLSNPITYAAVNPHFRAEFCRLKSKLASSVLRR